MHPDSPRDFGTIQIIYLLTYLIIIITTTTTIIIKSRFSDPGLTLIPYANGRLLTRDVKVVCSKADSYIDLAVQGPSSVAEMAASHNEAKNRVTDLQNRVTDSSYFPAYGSGNTGFINESARTFLDDLGQRISVRRGNEGICFYSNVSQLLFSVLMAYYCMTVFPLRTTQTSVSTANFFLFLFYFFPPSFL